MKKALLASLLLSGAAATQAQEYQSITNLNYTDVESFDSISLDSVYYFDARKVLGPLDEFSYINTTSNIFGAVMDNDAETAIMVGGEYFADNFMLGARFATFDEADMNAYGVTAGYLFAPNFIARVNYDDTDVSGADGAFSYEAQYVVDLNKNDYVGFTVHADEEFDNYGLKTKYFTDLGQGTYFVGNLDLMAGDSDSWAAAGEYFFSKMTSAFVSYNKYDDIEIGAKHFFNTNWALEAAYGNNTDESYDMYSLTLSAQF